MRAVILAAAGLALGGCTTMADVDAGVRQRLPQVCAAADTAYSGYAIWSIFRPVPERLDAKVQAARSALQPLCADPENATLVDVAAAAVRLTEAIAAARKAA